jgi:hypothetical protein
LAIVSPRLASAAPPPTAAAHEQARASYASGNEAFRLGDYERARSHYWASLQHERSFDALCNLGRTEATLGDDGLALRHLDECLKEYPPDDEVAPARQKFYALREEVRERCKKKDCEAGPDPAPAPAPVATAAAPASAAAPGPEPLPPAEPASARLPVSISLAAAGIVGLGVGTGFWIASEQSTQAGELKRDAIDATGGTNSCAGAAPDPRCAAFFADVSAAQDAHTVSVVGFVAGGALLAGALATYLLWPEPKASAGAGPAFLPHAAISPDGQSGHVGLSGTF